MLDFILPSTFNIRHFYSRSICMTDFHLYQPILTSFLLLKSKTFSKLLSLKSELLFSFLSLNECCRVGVERWPDGNSLIQRCDRLVIRPWSDWWDSVRTTELHSVLHADESTGANQWGCWYGTFSTRLLKKIIKTLRKQHTDVEGNISAVEEKE